MISDNQKNNKKIQPNSAIIRQLKDKQFDINKVGDSAVGTNLLLKTYVPFSMTGNNTTNQVQQMYSLSRILEKGTIVTLSFDAVSTAFAIFTEGCLSPLG